MLTKTILILSVILFGFGALVAMPEIAFAGSTKVPVCHIPPGNPANFHTISVGEKALQAHLNHGDLEGSCLASCDALCDDSNLCTQDVVSDPDQCICQQIPGPAVSCDDTDPCTLDSCDAGTGCINAAFVAVGSTGKTWAQANAECVVDGRTLASIHNQTEQDCAVAALTAVGAPGNGGFIGLHEDGIEGNWLWNDGTTVDYTTWLAGEPNNDSGQTTNVGHIWLAQGGQWNDVQDFRTDFGYVCR